MHVLIGGIQRFSIGDGPGIRSTVFFKGCPLSCQWCHNPELIKGENHLMYTANRCIGCGECVRTCPQNAISFRENSLWYNESKCMHCFACVERCCTQALHTAASQITVEEIMDILLKDKGYYDKTGGGVTFSGGECTMQYPFLERLMDLSRAAGVNTAIDTSGYCPSAHMMSLAKKADWLLYDIKCMEDARHRELTGVSNHLILSNLQALSQEKALRDKIIIRMPLISGVNDTPALIEAACEFICKCRIKTVHLLPYHLLGVSKYKSLFLENRVFESPGSERLEEILALFKEKGVEVSILNM